MDWYLEGQYAKVACMTTRYVSGTNLARLLGDAPVVASEGRAFPVPSADEAARLGYGQVEPVPMPQSLVARVPAGPALSRTAAGSAALG